MILTSILWVKLAQQLVYNLYEWQLREYRLDRFMEMVGRKYPNCLKALFKLTVASPLIPPRPFITTKAIVVYLLSIFYSILFFLLWGVVGIGVCILISPIIVFVAVTTLWFPEQLIRQIIYFIAGRKINYFQKNHNLITIGITGSYGKTTTKYFLSQVLSRKYKGLTTTNSINTPLGISIAIIKNLTTKHKFFIAEMGAYRKGEITQMCQIVKPSIGIITTIDSQHLALFKTQEDLIKAKSELVDVLPIDGVLLVNKKTPNTPSINRPIKDIVWYNKENRQLTKKARIPEFLKSNLEPAIILATRFGMSTKEVDETIKSISLPPNTMQQTQGYKNTVVINDSFNANPKGVLEALDFIATLPYKNRFVVMRCLVELGSESADAHIKIGRKIRKHKISAIIITDDYFQDIITGCGDYNDIKLIKNPIDIIKYLKGQLDKNSVILLEGKMNQKIINFVLEEKSV